MRGRLSYQEFATVCGIGARGIPVRSLRSLAFKRTTVIMRHVGRPAFTPMECPVCAAQNPDTASNCGKCRTPLPGPTSQETLNDAGATEDWSVAVSPQASAPAITSAELEA